MIWENGPSVGHLHSFLGVNPAPQLYFVICQSTHDYSNKYSLCLRYRIDNVVNLSVRIN